MMYLVRHDQSTTKLHESDGTVVESWEWDGLRQESDVPRDQKTESIKDHATEWVYVDADVDPLPW